MPTTQTTQTTTTQTTPQHKLAFRCKKCGRVHTSDDAAEAKHPHACQVCGAGVTFLPNGTKVFDPDNWESLADLTSERLAELGLHSSNIEHHKPWPAQSTNRPPRNIEVSASDSTGTRDSA